jgi:hypothetical protein
MAPTALPWASLRAYPPITSERWWLVCQVSDDNKKPVHGLKRLCKNRAGLSRVGLIGYVSGYKCRPWHQIENESVLELPFFALLWGWLQPHIASCSSHMRVMDKSCRHNLCAYIIVP